MLASAINRWKSGLVIVALLALIGWRVLSLGMADQLAIQDPERALRWWPTHPVALVANAERLVDSNPSRAESLARAALRADPRQGGAYRVLGQLAEATGRPDEAMALYETASRISPRDVRTHARLRSAYLRQGQAAPALRHMDLILRVQPRLASHEFPILAQLAAAPWAQADLASILLARPPWREGFVDFLNRSAPDSLAITPVMTRLRLAEPGFSERELSLWLGRLIKDQRWGEAYLTWATESSAAERRAMGNVFDGGFELEPSNMGFGWRIERVAGSYVERQSIPGGGGERALHVGFEDQRVHFRHVRQLLALPTGDYRLLGRSKADGLRNERGLVWTVRCAEGGPPLGETAAVKGATPWRNFQLDFTVPAITCEAQWLELILPARTGAEQRISGEAWFDDLRVISSQRVHVSP